MVKKGAGDESEYSSVKKQLKPENELDILDSSKKYTYTGVDLGKTYPVAGYSVDMQHKHSDLAFHSISTLYPATG